MAEAAPARGDRDREETVQRAVEAAIRIGVVALLGLWVFNIVAPFIQPIVWGAIIAVAGGPPYHWLERRLGGRTVVAAVLFTLARARPADHAHRHPDRRAGGMGTGSRGRDQRRAARDSARAGVGPELAGRRRSDLRVLVARELEPAGGARAGEGVRSRTSASGCCDPPRARAPACCSSRSRS